LEVVPDFLTNAFFLILIAISIANPMKILTLIFFALICIPLFSQDPAATPDAILQDELNLGFDSINIRRVMDLIDSGADPNIVAEVSAIDVIAARGTSEDLTLILKKGGRVNPKQKFVDGPLFKAVEYKNIPNIKVLILKKANLSAQNSEGYTPLEFSIVKKDTNIFNLLNIKGGNYNFKNDASILYKTNLENDSVMTKFLIKKGALLYPYESSEWLETELFKLSSLKKDHSRLMAAIRSVDKISTLEYDGTTALHIAAYLGDVEMIKLCLKKGSKLNEFDYQKDNALHYALANNQNNAAQYLILSGIDHADKVAEGGIAFTHLAAITGNMEMLKTLLQKGNNINFKDGRGLNTLTYAILSEDVNMVKYVLDLGVDPGEKDPDLLFTPRHFAAFLGDMKILEMVMKNYDAAKDDAVSLLTDSMPFYTFAFGPTETFRIFKVPSMLKLEVIEWLKQRGVKPLAN
jgi:ankyrin repeat protein